MRIVNSSRPVCFSIIRTGSILKQFLAEKLASNAYQCGATINYANYFDTRACWAFVELNQFYNLYI